MHLHRLSSSAQASQTGFALAAVLWLLAGLSIVVALIADAAHTSAERVAQLRERTEFVRSALSAQAHAEYWLSATRPRAADFTDGAASVMVDDRFYKIGEDSIIALQDVGGLMDLNTADPTRLAQFLVVCGIAPEQTSRLVDTLADYIDTDNLQRINGAEADSYQLAGLPPPRNRPLLAPGEVWDVMGWPAYRTTLEKSGCVRAMTTEGEAGIFGSSGANLATAPSPVLRAAGLPEETVQDIDNARGNPALVAERIAEANALTGANGGFVGMGGSQSQKTLRVTQRSLKGPWQITYTLVLDPEDNDRPWTIKQFHLQGVSAPKDRIQTLPWPSEAPATSPGNAAPNLPF
ncbi:type II secretion system protein GspK [Paracidovorax wautersii]|nr:type II secretion system protein GspK [Paracidovorax wautersii]